MNDTLTLLEVAALQAHHKASETYHRNRVLELDQTRKHLENGTYALNEPMNPERPTRRTTHPTTQGKTKRHMTAAGRARISAATKARWARVRKAKELAAKKK